MLIMVTASAQEAIFKKYAGQEGISVVNISKSMLGLMSSKAKGKKKIKKMPCSMWVRRDMRSS